MSDQMGRAPSPGYAAPDYALVDEIPADTPTRLKALGDPLRMLIADLVLERAMTVSELAERLARPKGSVAYHVDVLVDAGLLQVVRTRKVRAVEERFYGRVARTILFPDEPGEIPFLRDVVAEADLERPDSEVACLFTLRHARIPRERAAEWTQRLHALALEFIAEPRGGDVEYGLYVGLFPTNRTVAARRNDTAPQTPTLPSTKPSKKASTNSGANSSTNSNTESP